MRFRVIKFSFILFAKNTWSRCGSSHSAIDFITKNYGVIFLGHFSSLDGSNLSVNILFADEKVALSQLQVQQFSVSKIIKKNHY